MRSALVKWKVLVTEENTGPVNESVEKKVLMKRLNHHCRNSADVNFIKSQKMQNTS